MDSVAFLDAVREKHGLDSDRKLAKHLGINRARISMYRTGSRKLDPTACHAIAFSLDLEPGYVMACIQAERAKRTEDRDVWKRVAKILEEAKAASLMALVALVAFTAPLTDALATAGQCILC